MGGRRGPILNTSTRHPVLDQQAVDAVVDAARRGRPVVVPHSLPTDAVGDDTNLQELAESLPQGWWRATEGDIPEVIPECAPDLCPTMPGADDVIVTRMYHLQRMPQLRGLIDDIYDPLEKAWPDSEPWLERDAGFFVTSAGAVTQAHSDRAHNLLVQITGSKDIGLAAPGSDAHAAIVARSIPSLRVDEMPPETETVRLTAGFALYLPPYSIHWVRSLERSIAISCGWSSPATLHAGDVHQANSALQRLRFPAQPVGARGEGLKVRTVATAKRLRSTLSRA